jgi:hypothetical protein
LNISKPLVARWGWTGRGLWLQIEGREPVILANPDEFAMIPGLGNQHFCTLEPDEGWRTLKPLDRLADYQHSLPGKDRLPAYGGPKAKEKPYADELPPPMIV